MKKNILVILTVATIIALTVCGDKTDGALLNPKGEIITKQKADWQK